MKTAALLAVSCLCGAATAYAETDVEALAKKSQNPVEAMVSVPFQNNFNFGMGPDKEMGYNLNIQPVVPLTLSSNWNYIVRPILPILDIPLGGGRRKSGLGDLTLETFRLCKKLDLNFIGNVEGHDLFKDHVDVVVCDGFVGNIVLKTVESLAVAMFSMLKRELMHTTQRKLGAYLAKGAFHTIRRRMDPEVYGGAPLLGFNGLVFKAHGSARERAVTSAIRVTANAVKTQINQTIARDIAAANLILNAENPLPKS